MRMRRERTTGGGSGGDSRSSEGRSSNKSRGNSSKRRGEAEKEEEEQKEFVDKKVCTIREWMTGKGGVNVWLWICHNNSSFENDFGARLARI